MNCSAAACGRSAESAMPGQGTPPRPAPSTSSSEYVSQLPEVVDLDAVRSSGLRIGADPLGGASVAYWAEIADRFGLDLTVVNPVVDPTFRFMTLDWDGRIRMDCSSPHAMASLITRRTEFDIATGNDTDADRHGIVTPARGPAQPEPLPCRRYRLPLRGTESAGPPRPPSARRWSARQSSTG